MFRSKPFNCRDRRRSVAGVGLLLLLAACSPGTQPPAPPSGAPPAGSGGASGSPPPAPVSTDPAGWMRYDSAGFSIAAPPGWTPDVSHVYQALGPGKDIHGIAFTIPASMAAGTNLSTETYLAVETLPGQAACTAAAFLSDSTPAPAVTSGGVSYSVATSSQGAAGNQYDETVYAARGTTPCIAVRAFIHSTNIGNYDPGTIKAFDRTALVAQFDAIRATLKIDPAH